MDLFSMVATIGIDAGDYFTGLGKAKGAFEGFANVITKGLEVAGRATVNFIKDVVNTGMEMDKAMGQVYSVSGAYDEYTQSLLRANAMQEAANSIFDASEVAMAEYYEGLAGFSPDEITAGLHGIVLAAEAAGEPLKNVSDILTDTVTAFGEGAGEISRYADVFAATATSSNTTIMQMGQAMQYIGPVAGSLSYNLEDVATSIGLVADAGIKGSKAGTSLRNIMTRIATNAGVIIKNGMVVEPGALDIIESMGVAFYDAYGKARPWNEFLVDMREAWNSLDPEKAQQYAAAFTDMEISGEEAQGFVDDFAADLQTWRGEWNKLHTDVEKQNFAEELAPQFDALGISMYDSAGKLRNFGDVAHEAEIKLDGLGDQDRQFFGKKIGSLRGISAWLRLMQATNDEYDELYESTHNATGAAEKMRDVMYDNLYGDVVRFNAALDVLKTSIYDDIDGPMREVMQYGKGALDRITDAVNEGGLLGGIEQLGKELTDIAENEQFISFMESIGTTLAPIFDSILTSLLPALEQAGISLATGLLSGLSEGLMTSENPLVSGLGTILFGGKEALEGIGNRGGLFGLLFGKPSEERKNDYRYTATAPLASVSNDLLPPELRNEQPMDLTIDYSMQPGTMDNLASELGGVDTTQLATAISEAGTTGGEEAVTNVQAALGGIDTSSLAAQIGNAGPEAGAQIVSSIASALASKVFGITVSATVTGLPNSQPAEKHAKSMYGGTILRGATMFGINAAGQPMIGGDAGAEAIIGLNSLSQMIHQYVGEGFERVAAAPANIDRTLRDSVSGGLQDSGPELIDRLAQRVGEIVISAVSQMASKPTVVSVGGRELATATVDYNAIAANNRNNRYARGYGAGGGTRRAMTR